jgi:hypothetical protein
MAATEAALLKKLLKDELLKPRYRSDDPAWVIETVMQEQGIAPRLSNLLYQHRRSLAETPKSMAEQARVPQSSGGTAAQAGGVGTCGSASRPGDPELDVLAQLQARWRKHVEASVRSLCSELGSPLMWPSASAFNSKPAARGTRALQLRGVYEPEEMLHAIATAAHPNARTGEVGSGKGGLVPLHLRTPTLADLVERFSDLNAAVRQVGDRVVHWLARPSLAIRPARWGFVFPPVHDAHTARLNPHTRATPPHAAPRRPAPSGRRGRRPARLVQRGAPPHGPPRPG